MRQTKSHSASAGAVMIAAFRILAMARTIASAAAPRTCRFLLDPLDLSYYFLLPRRRLLPGRRLAEARTEPLHRLRLAADAQERAFVVGALLEHRAGIEDLAAHLLLGPGEEQLGLDQVLLEEG